MKINKMAVWADWPSGLLGTMKYDGMIGETTGIGLAPLVGNDSVIKI